MKTKNAPLSKGQQLKNESGHGGVIWLRDEFSRDTNEVEHIRYIGVAFII